jgi:hypothetical protein
MDVSIPEKGSLQIAKLIEAEQWVIWAHNPAIDANVIDKTGPKRTWFQPTSNADVQTFTRRFQVNRCVTSSLHIIYVENPVASIPDKAQPHGPWICEKASRAHKTGD